MFKRRDKRVRDGFVFDINRRTEQTGTGHPFGTEGGGRSPIGILQHETEVDCKKNLVVSPVEGKRGDS